MAQQEGGRWDVGAKSDAVYLERRSEDGDSSDDDDSTDDSSEDVDN